MRLFQSILAISLLSLAVSCKTYDRQQYSYSYRAPVHASHEKSTSLSPAGGVPTAAPEAAAPSASAPAAQ